MNDRGVAGCSSAAAAGGLARARWTRHAQISRKWLSSPAGARPLQTAAAAAAAVDVSRMTAALYVFGRRPGDDTGA